MGEPAIEARQLCRTFVSGRGVRRRRIEAVRNISFTVDAGERIAFIGPNGAGKSTSIKMLTGILHPSSGSASVAGLVPWEHRRTLATRIGTLFGQRSQLWPELPARETYSMLGAIHGLDRDDERRRIDELAALLDAADLFDRPVSTLSLGQRMRCELAAALLHDPEILLLDEPSIGLDLVAKRRFRELLVRLNEHQQTTIFLTSHDVADIEQVAERTIIVNEGTIVLDGSVAELRRTLLVTKRIEVGLARPIDADGLVWPSGMAVTEHSPRRARFDVDESLCPIHDAVDAVLDALPVADIHVSDPPLEEILGHAFEGGGSDHEPGGRR